MCAPKLALCLWVFSLCGLSSTVLLLAQSYTPDHPKVVKMVNRGVAFLDSYGGRALGDYSTSPILVGYTLLKATGDTGHPKVKSAVESAKRLTGSLESYRERGESKIVYESAIAGILLANIDPGLYKPNLTAIINFYESIQKAHGGFGYLGRETGDTSQTQYAMLALWTIHQAGVEVPIPLVEGTIDYLRSTMDPSGGWGYQGKVSSGRLIPQEGVSKSLATAGAGALMIGGDILSLYGQRRDRSAEDEEGIPKAFKRVDLELKKKADRRAITLTRADIEGPLQAAVRYQNTTKYSGPYWYYYWRYSQERYEAFLEIVNNRQEKSPSWYNAGVEELASFQNDDGSWGGEKGIRDITPIDVNTAFAILYLIRSTQKAIGKLDEGVSFGGYGLPSDVTQVRMVGDRIVSDEEISVQNLLTMLENEEASDVEIGLLPQDLQLADDPAARQEQINRLSRLVSSRDYRARRIAVKLLGRSDDLGVVPDLIYALTDPDDLVPMQAEEGLRLLSRKLNSGSLQAKPSEDAHRQAEAFWKKWYLGLRPDYVFIDR